MRRLVVHWHVHIPTSSFVVTLLCGSTSVSPCVCVCVLFNRYSHSHLPHLVYDLLHWLRTTPVITLFRYASWFPGQLEGEYQIVARVSTHTLHKSTVYTVYRHTHTNTPGEILNGRGWTLRHDISAEHIFYPSQVYEVEDDDF